VSVQQNHLTMGFQMKGLEDTRLIVFHQMKEGLGEWLTYLGNYNSVKKFRLMLIHPPQRPLQTFWVDQSV
jgi:hypothetical protein